LGGFRSFAASASLSCRWVGSGRSVGLETTVSSALPQVGCEPKMLNAAEWPNGR
jgi:hypothetical protein